MAKVNHQNTKASDCKDLQILKASVILQELSTGPGGVASVSCFQTITQHSNVVSLFHGNAGITHTHHKSEKGEREIFKGP